MAAVAVTVEAPTAAVAAVTVEAAVAATLAEEDKNLKIRAL